ncbi:AsmA family protein [Subsaximicrobium wynnwilliamsii]|uniref:AsmA family protein n=1 Tax=Subsaximicrobium wynnwilliamsii TaxID=291179 RepID=A0A5C6ZNJ4_9FLAO|nr:AsmA family protein [Subsaximicrobium wynnwilliamsii]TXD85531.1 AsmA family protein [Subsaximicrobium wynnwilliamsii]TXD90884.1 AsmA family protein [Subsaximicrobium wynnwilliamsii]TXE05391.1 AsmA family protein [Subsaximicrobium wynnwilliamsii]
MKKVLKVLGISILAILLLLIIIPFAFQGQIKDMVKKFVNQNLNAKVEFSDVSLSFLRSFPQAHVTVEDLLITNFAPFEGETFMSAKDIAFTMSIKELFKNADEDPIVVNSIAIDEALLTLKTDAFGNVNYDITKQPEASGATQTVDTANSSFKFDIEKYTIDNSAVTYLDAVSNTQLYITELNHQGNGIFSVEKSELDTKTNANVSMTIDSTQYLNNNKIKLDALIGLDLEQQKYTFMDNKGYINQLPLTFNGYVQMLDEGQMIDISFENPGSSFKDFLAVIPEEYSKNIENVETSGDFKVSGLIKGKITETTIPNLDISIKSSNASFKYPDLPKRVSNISIDTEIKNTTGNVDDTYVNINALDFMIDQDRFKSSATIKNLTANMLVNANIDGVLNLANLSKAYPIDFDKELSGILKAKLNMAFDMDAIEKNAYERIKANGTMSVSDFVFSSEDLLHPIQINTADLNFNPSTVTLNNFMAKTGSSDFSATGTINNLLGFLLSNKQLQGTFNLSSNTFVLNDFMTQDVAAAENPSEASAPASKTSSAKDASIKIPDFLDCTINANAKTVIYDNLTLKDVEGKLTIKDQEVTLQNLTSSIFKGILAVTGRVSTKTDTPTFNLDIGADGLDISQSFQDMDLLRNLAPIAKFVEGKLNSVISLQGTLNNSFSPNMNSISGSASADLLTTQVQPQAGSALSKLEGALNFIDFSQLDNKDIKVDLNFADGKVNVKPFNLNYKDIGIAVSGSHGFDKSLNYNAVFNVPAKYLGSEVNRLIGKINENNVNNLTIPVTANINGSMTSPQITTDLTSGITNLTQQLIEIEKQKLIGQGKDKVKDLLGGLLNGNQTNTTTDSTKTVTTDSTKVKTDPVREGVKDILGGLLNKRKKKADSTKSKQN